MFRIIFKTGQKIGKRPSFLIKFIANNWVYFHPIAIFFKIKTDICRFYKANSLILNDDSESMADLDILIVAAQKDFLKLPIVISQARKFVSQNEDNSIYIVVPRSQEQHEILSNLRHYSYIEVIPEDKLVDTSAQDRIRETYPKRFGWILQQLLKIEFVKNSRSRGVLVLDADTILMRKRCWLTSNGNQILTPTWENHKPYYDFLSEIGLDTGSIEFSFVPHHMLIQPARLNECLSYFGFQNLDDLLHQILQPKYLLENSPFSIDYEMYAQFMIRFYPSEISLEKWSNLQIDRSFHIELIDKYLAKYQNDFASLSFHN